MIYTDTDSRRNVLLRKVFHWLLPGLSRSGVISVDQQRREFFISVEFFIGVPLLLWFGFVEFGLDNKVLAGCYLVGIVLMSIDFSLLHLGRSSIARTRLIGSVLLAIFFITLVFDRGPQGLTYFLLLPPIAVFVLGYKEGAIWSVVTFVAILLIMNSGVGPVLLETREGFPEFAISYGLLFVFSLGFEAVHIRVQETVLSQNERLVTEQARLVDTQVELAAREAVFRQYADLATDWLFETDVDLNLIYVSPRFELATGHSASSFFGAPVSQLLELYEECDVEEHLSGFKEQKPFKDFRYCLKSTQGDKMFVVSRGEPVRDARGKFTGYLCTNLDVTDYETFQKEIREKDRALNHVQKLDAIGQLTSGVAHDFNNLLTVVKGNLEILRFTANESWDTESLVSIETAVDQASDLTGKLLSFSQQQPLAQQSIDLREVLDEVSTLVRHSLGERISLEVISAPDLRACLADRSQLGSAILNLALNARDAMSNEGHLVITAKNLIVERAEPDLQVGNYVILSVIDEGSGMPQNVLDKVTEPFFTTKPAGQGTGLGLSMVYGFVTHSGGTLQIESAQGVGTKVSIILPQATESMKPLVTPTLGSEISQDSMLALMVEDESSVQKIVGRMLRLIGYETIICNNAEEALIVLKDYMPNLLVTDMMLGTGMDGLELADEVRVRCPDTKILMMSGYPEEILDRRNESELRHELLRKPFGYKDLETTLERLFVAS